jgi:capsular polysaccharide export protein
LAQAFAPVVEILGEIALIREGLQAFAGRRVLLLQGPLGPFFRRLASDLEAVGAQVSKIDFNGGDWLFSPSGSIAFRGTAQEWADYFESFVRQHDVDVVLLFGDCRPLHRIAHQIAERLGVEVGVFEEGYIRPDYVTLERFGVNGNSLMPRDPEYFLKRASVEAPATLPVGNTFWNTACWASLYYIASALLWPFFRHYVHHRPLTVSEGWPWLRSAWRKQYFKFRERGIQQRLAGVDSKRFFLVALQVHNDAQIHAHSEYPSVEAFIESVINSFGDNAHEDALLVIKHHPMDRGYHDYSKLISRLAAEQGVEKRVLYIHDQHLPTLLENAQGVVLVNSTVGLSALDHGTPLKVCGSAIFDMLGLTYQGPLACFWSEAEQHKVSPVLHRNFRNYLIERTQLNGSFYRRLALPDSDAGLVWSYRSSGRTLSLAPECNFQ